MMRTLIFLVFIFLLEVTSKKLSEDENLKVQMECGRTPFHTATNDSTMYRGQHPWAVAVYTKLKLAEKKTMRFTISPGVLISPRHILISSVVWIKDSEFSILGIQSINDNVTLEGDNVVLSKELLYHFDFGFDLNKAFDWNGDFRNLIASAVVIGAADINKRAPRLMLLELKEDIPFTKDVNAACMPAKSNPWDAVKLFPIYGSSLVGVFKVVDFKHVNCSDAAPLVCAESLNIPRNMCEKTAGGVVVGPNGVYTVMGLFSRRWSCDNHNISMIKITDVHYYRNEICELSGACGLPELTGADSLGSITEVHLPTPEITSSEETTPFSFPSLIGYYTREIRSTTEHPHDSWTVSTNFEKTTLNASVVSTTETHAVTDFPMKINETTTPETDTKPAPADSIEGIVTVLNKLVDAVQTIQIHAGNKTTNIVINVN